MFSYQIDTDTHLKLLEYGHIHEYYDLVDRNRATLRHWLPWLDSMQNEDDARRFIDRTRQQWFENNGFTAGIFYHGKICGIVGFNSVNWKHRHISIGYWLGAEYQGKGIMTRACTQLVNYAFQELHLHRVVIETAVENLQSRAIPERLGFILEGIARQSVWLYDHYVDYVTYSMLLEEWEHLKSKRS